MVECRDVCKTYRVRERPGLLARSRIREVPALQGVSVQIPAGQIVGLLGPNGAGKTTLLKILSTLLIPDSGLVRVAGEDSVRHPQAVRRRVGVVLASERSLYWKLTARENLAVYGGLYDLPAAAVRRRGAQLLAQVGLADREHVPVEKYSAGMLKRLMIARALLHRPAVLILDEPSAGLDVQGKRELWRLLRHLAAAEQVTALLATHDMEEAEAVPERLLVICQGRVYADGPPAVLRREAGRTSVLTIDLAGPPPAEAGWTVAPTADGFRVTVHTATPERDLPELIRRLPGAVRVERRDPTLGEAFLALTGSALEGDA